MLAGAAPPRRCGGAWVSTIIGNPIELPISEPFWAVAFPDVPVTIRRTDTTATHFIGMVAQWSDTMYLAVEDQYGNPVSNVPVSFDVGGIQTRRGLQQRASR